jgi:hypothetical protein
VGIESIGASTPLPAATPAPVARPAAGGFSTAAANANAGGAQSALQQQQTGGGGGHGGGSHAKAMHAITNIAARNSLKVEKRKTAAERQAEIDEMQAQLEAEGDGDEGDLTDERDEQPEA